MKKFEVKLLFHMKAYYFSLIIGLLLGGVWPSLSAADSESKDRHLGEIKKRTHLKTIYYTDTRGFNTLTLNYSSDQLPWGLKFWGFVDLHGDQDLKGPDNASSGGRSDLSNFFTENRLTKMLGHGFGFQAEHNDANGKSNNLMRMGVVYTLPFKPFVQLRAFPVETDGDGGQVSVVWSFRIFETALYFEGFFDHNFRSRRQRSDRQVYEPQLRYMITEQLGFVAEYRVNEYLRAPASRSHRKGMAWGVYYTF